MEQLQQSAAAEQSNMNSTHIVENNGKKVHFNPGRSHEAGGGKKKKKGPHFSG